MPKVLLVDEVREIVDLEKTFLKRTGCEILTVRTGDEALAAARAMRPDLILLEARMPGLDGPACCRALKSDPDLRGIPVVFVTSTSDYPRCFQAGGDGFVPKPVTKARLMDAMRRFVPMAERGGERLPIVLKVEYTADGLAGMGFTRDLSADGMFLKTRDVLQPGSLVDLEFALPTLPARTIHTRGRIIHLLRHEEDTTGAGVQFVGMTSRDRLEIARFARVRAAERA